MAFVGICIIFQAIISDVYVYKKVETQAPTVIAPTPATLHPSSIVPPTPWVQSSKERMFQDQMPLTFMYLLGHEGWTYNHVRRMEIVAQLRFFATMFATWSLTNECTCIHFNLLEKNDN